MPELDPELYGIIAKYLKANETEFGRLELLSASRAQAQLAPLIQSSRAAKDGVSPVLYEDCLVTDPNALARSLSAGADNLKHTTRLRFVSLDKSIKDPVMKKVWAYMVSWFGVGGPDQTEMEKEQQGAQDIVKHLHSAEGNGDARPGKTLPNLTRVVMDASDCDKWQQMLERSKEADIATHPLLRAASGTKSLPVYLIHYPSVEHYCQSSVLGPYALPHTTVCQPNSPPKTVTFHLPPRFFGDHKNFAPPLVAGCLNRIGQGPIPTEQLRVQLGPIMRILGVPSNIQEGTGPIPRPYLRVLQNTTIEIYNHVRPLRIPDEDWARMQQDPLAAEWVSAPTGSLVPLQRYLDSLLGPYRGKIMIKLLEDAAPCPACDLDPAAQWRESQRLGIWTPPDTSTRKYESADMHTSTLGILRSLGTE